MIVDQWCVSGESRDNSFGNDSWSMMWIGESRD